jgi:hypothetical protein
LALNFAESGGQSVGIVRLRTKDHRICFVLWGLHSQVDLGHVQKLFKEQIRGINDFPPKHGVTSQKTAFFWVTAMKTSNLTKKSRLILSNESNPLQKIVLL